MGSTGSHQKNRKKCEWDRRDRIGKTHYQCGGGIDGIDGIAEFQKKQNVVGDRRDRCSRTKKKVVGDRRDRCYRTDKNVVGGSTGSTGSMLSYQRKSDDGIKDRRDRRDRRIELTGSQD